MLSMAPEPTMKHPARGIEEMFRCLFVVLIVLASLLLCDRKLVARAQDSKGGPVSVKSPKGAGYSRFSSENIVSVQQQQQQVIEPNAPRIASVVKRPPITKKISQQTVVQEVSSQQQETSDPEPTLYGSVEGTPGVDFPGYTSIPDTKFNCDGLPFETGLYADESTGCQVYHLCYRGRRESFLCGVGTIFNQAILNCDFWHSVECSKSSQYYHVNADFGRSRPEPEAQSRILPRSGWKAGAATKSLTKASLKASHPVYLQPTISSSVRQPKINLKSLDEETTASKRTKGGLQTAPDKGKGARRPASVTSSVRTGSGLLSPSRRVQLLQRPGSGAQMASESSTLSEVASRADAVQATIEPDEPGTTLKGAAPAQVSRGQGWPAPGKKRLSAEAAADEADDSFNLRNGIQPSSGNNNQWRPYFKSKSKTPAPALTLAASAKAAATTTTSAPTSMSTSATTFTVANPTTTFPPEATRVEGQANKEPNFVISAAEGSPSNSATSHQISSATSDKGEPAGSTPSELAAQTGLETTTASPTEAPPSSGGTTGAAAQTTVSVAGSTESGASGAMTAAVASSVEGEAGQKAEASN